MMLDRGQRRFGHVISDPQSVALRHRWVDLKTVGPAVVEAPSRRPDDLHTPPYRHDGDGAVKCTKTKAQKTPLTVFKQPLPPKSPLASLVFLFSITVVGLQRTG